MKIVKLKLYGCAICNEEMKQHFGKLSVNNFAPWIDVFKNEAKTITTELHIVAPNVYSNKDVYLLKIMYIIIFINIRFLYIYRFYT